MAHYAFLDDDNVVIEVIVGRDENDLVESLSDWESYYGSVRGKVCKRTSYNTHKGVHYDPETGEVSEDQSKAFRGNYAGIGFSYNHDLDAFIPPQPNTEWVLNQQTYSWEAPSL